MAQERWAVPQCNRLEEFEQELAEFESTIKERESHLVKKNRKSNEMYQQAAKEFGWCKQALYEKSLELEEERRKKIEALEKLESCKRNQEQRYAKQVHLSKKVAAHRAQCEEMKIEQMKEKLQYAEDQFINSSQSLSAALLKAEELERKNEGLRLSIQQGEFQIKLKAVELEKERERSLNLEKKLTEVEGNLKQERELKLCMRQRAAVYKEKIVALESSTSPELLREMYEEKMKDMELKALRDQRAFQLEAHKALVAREEELSKTYKKIADDSIDHAKKAMEENARRIKETNRSLEDELKTLREKSIPLDLHRKIVGEVTTSRQEAERLYKAGGAVVEKEITKANDLVLRLETSERSFQNREKSLETILSERNATIRLLENRIIDLEQSVREKTMRIDTLESNSLQSSMMLTSKAEKWSQSRSELVRVLDQVKSERADQKKEIQVLSSRIHEKEKRYDDLQKEGEKKQFEHEKELEAAGEAQELLKRKLEEVLRTVSRLMDEIQVSREEKQDLESRLEELALASKHEHHQLQRKIALYEGRSQNVPAQREGKDQTLRDLQQSNQSLSAALEALRASSKLEIQSLHEHYSAKLANQRQDFEFRVRQIESKVQQSLKYVRPRANSSVSEESKLSS